MPCFRRIILTWRNISFELWLWGFWRNPELLSTTLRTWYRGYSWLLAFPIDDVSIRSGNIRDQSLSCPKSRLILDVLPSQILTVRVPKTIMPTPWHVTWKVLWGYSPSPKVKIKRAHAEFWANFFAFITVKIWFWVGNMRAYNFFGLSCQFRQLRYLRDVPCVA